MAEPVRVNFVSRVMSKMFTEAGETLRSRGWQVGQYGSVEELLADRAALEAMDVFVAPGSIVCDAKVMKAAPKLRAIISPITGTDHFDEKLATELGIVVANGQAPENYISMAEATVMLTLVALYDLNFSQKVLRENLPRPAHLRARMVLGKRIGIVGFGQIAQAVAERLSTWGAELVTYIRTPRELPSYIGAVPLEELLSTSDVVIVLTGLSAETRHMLDAGRLALMKPNVVFVNTARGAIVDEAALIALARERPAMRLALDVFEKEPLAPDSPMRDIPDAVLTPHMAGHTIETHDRLPVLLIENIDDAMAGRPPRYVRNPAVLESWVKRWA